MTTFSLGPNVKGKFKLCILSNTMEPRLSSEAASCAATLEIHNILSKPKFYYRVHKSPQLVSIVSQMNPIHTTQSYSSKIYFNIILQITSRRSKWYLFFMNFLTKPYMQFSSTMYAALPNSSSMTSRKVQDNKLLIMQISVLLEKLPVTHLLKSFAVLYRI
jgi:hypothetical protein